MSDDMTGTIRLVRRSKVITDDVGGTVWNEPVEETELELVSTMMLEVMIDADEDTTRLQLKDLQHAGAGVLAHDAAKNTFEVIPQEEVVTALAGSNSANASTARVTSDTNVEAQAEQNLEELSLVSTAMVKVMIEKPELSPKEAEFELELLEEAATGFDPYNNS